MRELHEVPNVAAMTRARDFYSRSRDSRPFPVSSISPPHRRTVSLIVSIAFPTLSHQRHVVRLYVSMWGREGENGKGATVEHTYRLRIYNKVYTNTSSCRLST